MNIALTGVIRIRGTWARGMHYVPGDVVVQGPATYQALVDHVSGDTTQPVFGPQAGEFWGVLDASLGRQAQPQAPHTPPAAGSSIPAAQVVPFPVVMPAGQPALPADVPSAEHIADTSNIGLPNVAMSLSWLKEMVGHAARREWVADELERLQQLIERLAHRLEGLGPPAALPHDDPLETEKWRRIARVLDARNQPEAEAIRSAMGWEMLRLLRKRDRGEIWTAQEAARAAVLDVLDREVEAIEAAAKALSLETPDDLAGDKHWPRIGGVR